MEEGWETADGWNEEDGADGVTEPSSFSEEDDFLKESENIDVDEIFRDLAGGDASGAEDDTENLGEGGDEEDTITLETLLGSVPELAEDNETLEKQIAASASSAAHRRRVLIDTDETPLRKDWRETCGQDSVLLQWITHLCHIARKGLGSPEAQFQRSFCALHQLYLICALVPLPAILVTHRQGVKEGAADGTDIAGEKSSSVLARYRQLSKIMTIAFRCASAKISRSVPVDNFSIIFTPEYNSSDVQVQRVFAHLASIDTAAKLSTMKKAGEEILHILQERMGRDLETSRIHDEILQGVRKDIVESRVSRSTAKAIKRARVDVH